VRVAALLMAAACGARTELGLNADIVEEMPHLMPEAGPLDASSEPEPGPADAPMEEVALNDSAPEAAIVDDPTTLGDERPGYVECRKKFDPLEPMKLCGPGQTCCVDDATCEAPLRLTCENPQVCDGDEDCPAGKRCCLENQYKHVCKAQCSDAPYSFAVKHRSCGGACGDADLDTIPDAVDDCSLFGFEDGLSPRPEDGCPQGEPSP